MSAVLELQSDLQETQALLAKLEQAAAQNPASIGLRLNGQSVAKRFRELEVEFERIASQAAIDICRYRLFGDSHDARPTVPALAKAMLDFQQLFSTAYDAVKNGPRKKTVNIPEVQQESTFGFGYFFAGSVGIVMTIEKRQRSLFSNLDQTMHAVFDLARSRTTEEVVNASASLGGPTVRALNNWVTDHLSNGLGIDVEWLSGTSKKAQLILQVPELKQLSAVLSEAAESIEGNVTLKGELVGLETAAARRWFHFIPDDGEEMRGSYSPNAISIEKPAKTPARYEATFQRTAKKILATGEEKDESFYLVSLEPID